MNPEIAINHSKQFEKEHPINRFAIFGSVSRGETNEDIGYSDPNINKWVLKYTNIAGGRIDNTSQTAYFYLTDHLGSTRFVLSDKGEVAEAYMYDAYGTMYQITVPSTDETREKFTGKELDEDGAVTGVTGGVKLYYFGARFYDPEIGMWNSTDPREQFFNTYSYCGGDPANYIDPNGEYVPWGAILMVTGALAGGYIGGISGNEGELNPLKWKEWGPAGAGFLIGAAAGAGLGYGIETGAFSGAFFEAAEGASQSGEIVGQLTIYSSNETAWNSFLRTGMHSFLQLTLNKGYIKLGGVELEYFDTWANYPGVRPDQLGDPSRMAYKDALMAEDPYLDITKRSVDITQEQLNTLMDRITYTNMLEKSGQQPAWSISRPCSHFAPDIWKEVTGETLGDVFIHSDPRVLYKSINIANKIIPK